jgi:tyrosyl-tRNA synthetase
MTTEVSVAPAECKLVWLDKLLVESGLAPSRRAAQQLIAQNAVQIKEPDLGWEGREVWGQSRHQAIVPFRREFALRVRKKVKLVTVAE